MIRPLDSAALPTEPLDLVIVGSGPAGGILAAELVRLGRAAGRMPRIALVESGGRRPTESANRLREVESQGLSIKEYSRERVLGGSSSTWAGLSAPLDACDFAPRPGLCPGSHWPIQRADLWPHYRAASERHGFAALDLFAPGALAKTRQKGQLQPEFRDLDEKVFLAADPPQRFGERLRPLFESDAIQVYLSAHATALEVERDGHRCRAKALRLRRSDGAELRLEARRFVLATGGIENARLLLNSLDPRGHGLGNGADQVGRYFMNHPKNYFGILRLARPVESAPYFFGFLHQGFAGYGGLRLCEEQQAGRGLLNSYVRFEPLFPWSDNEGVESLVGLVKRAEFLLRGWKKAQGDKLVELRDYSETGDDSELQNQGRGAKKVLELGKNVLLHLPSVAQYAWFRAVARRSPRISRVRLRNFMEMEPRPENRVLLSERRDRFGMPLPRIVADVTARDRHSMVAVQQVLAAEFERLGLGRLEGALGPEHEAPQRPWPIDQDASHHLGTTRMGSDPSCSVVDPDLRIHGCDNVHLAGGSVFPTSGCANPTYTIAALSIRLAEHLYSRLAAPPHQP
jgi:choline dehydrogenase-like flavoprotein